MKRLAPWIPLVLVLLAGLWLLEALIPRRVTVAADEFGRLPVLLQGRTQPLDSVARNALLQLRTKQTIYTPKTADRPAETTTAIAWLKEMLFQPDKADARPVFRIDHPEAITLMKLDPAEKYFSFAQLRPQLPKLGEEAQRIGELKPKTEQQTPFERAVTALYQKVVLYHRLQHSLKPPGVANFTAALDAYEQAIPTGVAAARAREAGQTFDQAAFDALIGHLGQFEQVARFAYPLMVPAGNPGHSRDDWVNAGSALMEAARGGKIPEPVRAYAAMQAAFRTGDDGKFRAAVADYGQWLAQHGYQPEQAKVRSEHWFNRIQVFYHAMGIYVVAFVLACVSWFHRSETLRRSAVWLAAFALCIHTIGLVYRMVLEGRPPVTNLYSSAVFIGWGAAIFGLVLERVARDGLGTVVASSAGFSTLIIAHHLALGGDTMAMLQAVLDTNFWLATHVVVVTLGYSATFVAGFLAMLYVIRGFFTSTLSAAGGKSLEQMVYGVICFATLFSFVGTVLGGIWADQSWGRFWGWDPKENGALLIVIWNAFYLHARWGRILSEKALMAVALVGNIVTAFSWFGTNMLGIGLHAYGFMDAAFKWLMFFNATQLVLIAITLLPLRFWRSFRATPVKPATAEGKLKPAAA